MLRPIRLKIVERITNKDDGTQDVTASLVDAATGAPVLGMTGFASQLNASGRAMTISFSGVRHEIENF